MKMPNKVTIFTDGSCDHRSKLGGIGVYIIEQDGAEHYISHGYNNTTISRMEGIALLTAIRSLRNNVQLSVTIYSDSEYIIKSFTEKRLERWALLNWEGVKNVDMWKAIIEEIKSKPLVDINFVHIRGHQKNIEDDKAWGNNVADMLSCYKVHKKYDSDKVL